MLRPSYKRVISTTLVLALLFTSSDFRASNSVTVNGKWNIYTITLDRITAELGRGATTSYQAEVLPPDQELVFFTSEPDSRIDVSVDPATGRFRTIVVHDLTAEGDGSPDSPSAVSIQARLPDDTTAKTPGGEDVACVTNLVKPFYERVLKRVQCLDCEVQTLINQIPGRTHDGVRGQIQSGLLRLAQETGSAPPSQAFLNAFADSVDAPVTNLSNEFGERMGAEIVTAIKTSDTNQGFTLVPRDAPPLVPIADPNNKLDVTVNSSVNGFKLKFLDGNSGPTYSFSEFIEDLPASLTRTTIDTTAATAHLNATLKTADFSVELRSTYKIHNSKGGNVNPIDPFDFNEITIKLQYKFGPP